MVFAIGEGDGAEAEIFDSDTGEALTSEVSSQLVEW